MSHHEASVWFMVAWFYITIMVFVAVAAINLHQFKPFLRGAFWAHVLVGCLLLGIWLAWLLYN